MLCIWLVASISASALGSLCMYMHVWETIAMLASVRQPRAVRGERSAERTKPSKGMAPIGIREYHCSGRHKTETLCPADS